MRLFKNNKAQSTAEYAILIGLVIGVLVVMQTYMKRGVQGRIRDASDYNLNTLSKDTNWETILDTQPTAITKEDSHYEFNKYSATRTRETQAGTTTTEKLDTGGKATRDITEVTQQAAGDYQKYDYDVPVAK